MPLAHRLKALRAAWRQEIHNVSGSFGIGVQSTYTLVRAPQQNGSLIFALNGTVQRQGIGLDYTVSGTTITYLGTVAITTADHFIAAYVSED